MTHVRGSMTRARVILAATALISIAQPAYADRVQLFTIRPEEGSFCESDLQAEIKKVKGLKKWTFDKAKLQLAVTSAKGLPDAVILDAIGRARARCASEEAEAALQAPDAYPTAADVLLISKGGESIGSLKKHVAPGKYTVFDVYADWCGPCRLVDKKLRQVVATRTDVAVRKINIVDFNKPVAKELGPRLRGLPYVVVFDPKGKRTDIMGANLDRLASALTSR